MTGRCNDASEVSPMAGDVWSEEHVGVLTARVKELGYGGVAALLCRSRDSVKSKAIKMGLMHREPRPKPEWTEERIDVVLRYTRLAYRYANKHFRRSGGRVPIDELEGEALFALKVAALHYDPDRCAVRSPGPLLKTAINNRLVEYVQHWHKRHGVWETKVSDLRPRGWGAQTPGGFWANRRGEAGSFEPSALADNDRPDDVVDLKMRMEEGLIALPPAIRSLLFPTTEAPPCRKSSA